jgi:hypothetical protein
MKLVFHGTSTHWEEGIPLGNGRMGAVLCSEPETDVLYLNDDTLWSGYPHEGTAALTPKIVTAARQAVFRDDYAAATRIIGETHPAGKGRADVRTVRNGSNPLFGPFGQT